MSQQRRRKNELEGGPTETGLTSPARFATLLLQIGVVLCILVMFPASIAGLRFYNEPKEMILDLIGLIFCSPMPDGCSIARD
jgi:hypothetical protein